MLLKRPHRSLVIAGLLTISAPFLAQALTWDEWNHSTSPFCGFISIFCAPRPAPPAQVAVVPAPAPAKAHKQKSQKPVVQPQTPS